ncbi:hypothetical protein ACW9HR_24645 [Nocardia gipuzkoensis]
MNAYRTEIGRRDFRLAAAAVVGSINGLMHDWTIGWVDAGIEQVTDELILMATSELRAQLAENPARLARATSNEHLSSD